MYELRIDKSKVANYIVEKKLAQQAAPGDAPQPHSARSHAPTNLREALIREQ